MLQCILSSLQWITPSQCHLGPSNRKCFITIPQCLSSSPVRTRSASLTHWAKCLEFLALGMMSLPWHIFSVPKTRLGFEEKYMQTVLLMWAGLCKYFKGSPEFIHIVAFTTVVAQEYHDSSNESTGLFHMLYLRYCISPRQNSHQEESEFVLL